MNVIETKDIKLGQTITILGSNPNNADKSFIGYLFTVTAIDLPCIVVKDKDGKSAPFMCDKWVFGTVSDEYIIAMR